METALESEKYYVITHGARQSYKATVHRETCPMFPRFKNAHVWDRNPIDGDRWNHYQKCQRCWAIGEPEQKG